LFSESENGEDDGVVFMNESTDLNLRGSDKGALPSPPPPPPPKRLTKSASAVGIPPKKPPKPTGLKKKGPSPSTGKSPRWGGKKGVKKVHI